ncbi:MAG TPA: hypothetical protein VHA10_01425 [Hypericibacter adhaerens]|jgi:hypothetical protein|uniref:Uncharacterized protein n=1 Tax=Hypericibacter adhaerens TaxID=2602016 RepID=A0A5J6MSN9_9PROT|nr:hypothetical protein [Hypericibacter adhaerens]QEX20323.1 hypothetical protein FRZ61_02400 [Hypericibacter adhaerens]HWA41841.1 hypothetical protein [Hypericibacter adhaerens]
MAEPEEQPRDIIDVTAAPKAAVVRLTPVAPMQPAAAAEPLPPEPAAWPSEESGPSAVFALPPAYLRKPPVLGLLAVIYGIVALIKLPILFGPLAILFAIAAACRKQFWYAALGAATGAAGLVSSTTFWLLLGGGWLINYLL